MNRTLLRAARIIISPNAEWRVVADERPHPRTIIALFVLPLALIPAAGWILGLLLFGNSADGGRDSTPVAIGQIVHSGLITYFAVVLSVVLCAASIVIVAPLFSGLRSWPRALQIAAYSAAPVLIGGLLLILPNLVFALIVPFFHGLYLQYAGLQHVLAVKERDAAEYVALSSTLLMVFSTALGAAGIGLGII